MEERYQDSQIGNVLRTSHPNAEVRVFITKRPKDKFNKDIILPEEELVSSNIMTENIPPITESVATPPQEDTFDVEAAHFMQVVPDSQFFTELEQILEYARYRDPYLFTGIKNSIEKGYFMEMRVLQEGLVPLREPFNKKTQEVDDQDFDDPHANKHNT